MGSFLIAGILLFLVILTVLPLVFYCELFYDFQNNKVGCHISLFGIVKIIGGYLAPCPNGIAFHSSKKKAFIFNFREIGEEGKNFSVQHALRLRKVIVVSEINAESYFLLYFIAQIGKLCILFQEHAPTFNYFSRIIEEENARFFIRLTFSTILVKELFLFLKNLVFKGVNHICQKKKLAA